MIIISDNLQYRRNITEETTESGMGRNMKRSSSFSIKSLLFVMCLFVITAFAAVSARADEGEEVTVDNGIPVVYLNIDESQGTIDELINSPDHSAYAYGKISIVVPEGFHYSDFEDLPCESIDGISMSIRGRGNSSWKQSGKRPFKIKLDKKTDIFGLGSNKHWVLLANAFDETLIRNRITGWLGEQMGFDFTPRGVPVDLVLKGEIYGTHYLGSYYLSENVRVDKNRLEIEELDEDDTDPDIITGGYLIQNSMQVRKGSPDRFTTIRGAEWATHTPSFDTEEETLSSEEEDGEEAFAHSELGDAYKNNAQQEYIQNYIQHFEDVLFEEGTAYRDLMDVENSAKYWLINTFPKNQDGYGTGSTYIYKDRDKDGQVSKLYWGPVWDFDFAWTRNFNVEGFTSGHKWLGPMFYDRGEGGFVQEIKKQWPAMRTSLEELIAEGGVIDKYYEETKVSAQMDHETLNPGEEFDYKAAVDRLKTWIRDRIDWVDANLDLLDEMVHKVTFIADGEVFAFDFYPVEDYLTGRERYPEKEGYTFLGWYDEDGNKIENQTYLQEDITLTARYVADDEVTHATDIAFGKDSDIVGYNAFFSTYKIQYEILPVDAFDKQLVWTSSDESIATVDENGFVKYYGPGTVVFTAALRLGRTRQFTLTIADGEPPAPDSIRPEEDVIRMKVGEQAAFTILTDPNPAKIRGYEYESDDTDVVTVEELGVLSAVGPGETEVSLRANPAVSLRVRKRASQVLNRSPEQKKSPNPGQNRSPAMNLQRLSIQQR